MLEETAGAISAALGALDDWGLAGTIPGQYRWRHRGRRRRRRAAREPGPGCAVGGDRSSPSGPSDPRWWSSSRRFDQRVAWHPVVRDQPVRGRRRRSGRGVGGEPRQRDDVPSRARGGSDSRRQALTPSRKPRSTRRSLRSVGIRANYLGWYQFRALGAAALDLCAVAAGVVDAYIDCSWNAHGRGTTSAACSCAVRLARWWSTRRIVICHARVHRSAHAGGRRHPGDCSTTPWPQGARSGTEPLTCHGEGSAPPVGVARLPALAHATAAFGRASARTVVHGGSDVRHRARRTAACC